jgi:uncharacterized membrane protein
MSLSSNQRMGSIIAGVALMQVGSRVPRLRTMSRAVGLGLVAQGVTGYSPVAALSRSEQSFEQTRAALSGPSGFHVRDAVTIARPRAELYRMWRELKELPNLLPHVRRIDRLSDARSQWTVVGESGVPVVWEAELVNDVENEIVAWRSSGSRVVAHAGSVRFRDVPAGTETLVHLQYQPVAGTLGWLAARLLGHNPRAEVREDLRRMKQQLETGEIASVRGQPSGRIEQSARERGIQQRREQRDEAGAS